MFYFLDAKGFILGLAWQITIVKAAVPYSSSPRTIAAGNSETSVVACLFPTIFAAALRELESSGDLRPESCASLAMTCTRFFLSSVSHAFLGPGPQKPVREPAVI